MEFSTKASTPDRIKSGCVVVGVYADRTLTAAAGLVGRQGGAGRGRRVVRSFRALQPPRKLRRVA